jgi:hypothetical protein
MAASRRNVEDPVRRIEGEAHEEKIEVLLVRVVGAAPVFRRHPTELRASVFLPG